MYKAVVISVNETPPPERITAVITNAAETIPTAFIKRSTFSGRHSFMNSVFSSAAPSSSPMGSRLKIPVKRFIAAAG